MLDLISIYAGSMGAKEVEYVRVYLNDDAEAFEFSFRLMLEPETRVAWHAAWVLDKTSRKNPEKFDEKKVNMLIKFALTNKHSGLQRLTFSMLYNLPLHEPISVEFINLCIEQMISPHTAIAVQALSLKMMLRICVIEPDFIPEMRAILENIDENGCSEGFRAMRKKSIKLLNNRK